MIIFHRQKIILVFVALCDCPMAKSSAAPNKQCFFNCILRVQRKGVTMIIACKLDDSKFTSEDIAEFIDLCKKCGIECNIPAQVPTVSTPAVTLPKPKPKAKPKATPSGIPTHKAIKDEFGNIKYPYALKGNGIVLGYGDGKTGCKEMLKHYGFSYEKGNTWAWVGGDFNLLPHDKMYIHVPAEWVEVGKEVGKARNGG
jgi:hypothetical protein